MKEFKTYKVGIDVVYSGFIEVQAYSPIDAKYKAKHNTLMMLDEIEKKNNETLVSLKPCNIKMKRRHE